MTTDVQKILTHISEIERRFAMTHRHGTVHEVKDGMVRVLMGTNEQGEPWLSPWMHPGNTHFGNVREEIPYKKDQNATVVSPGGDPSQGIIQPYAPSEKFPRPDHASDEEHTYQFGDLKLARKGDRYIIQQGEDRVVHIHKDKGITGRVGQNRFQSHEKGAKISVGSSHWAVVSTEAPHLRISEPWVIAGDPIPNDDSVVKKKDENQGGSTPPT